MPRLVLFAAAVTLSACGQSPEAAAPRTAEATRLPLDNSTGFLDGYSLRVTRERHFLWNSMPISDTEFTEFLRKFSALPRAAGALFVAFEPSVAPARAEWVRRQVIASGLCKQQRCFEVGWDVKRPVVN